MTQSFEKSLTLLKLLDPLSTTYILSTWGRVAPTTCSNNDILGLYVTQIAQQSFIFAVFKFYFFISIVSQMVRILIFFITIPDANATASPIVVVTLRVAPIPTAAPPPSKGDKRSTIIASLTPSPPGAPGVR